MYVCMYVCVYADLNMNATDQYIHTYLRIYIHIATCSIAPAICVMQSFTLLTTTHCQVHHRWQQLAHRYLRHHEVQVLSHDTVVHNSCQAATASGYCYSSCWVYISRLAGGSELGVVELFVYDECE